MKMDKYMSCVDFLLYSTFRISIREGAMSEDEIIDKLIESAYQDATRQGAFYALIKKEYENNLKEKANDARDEAKRELKNKISKFNTYDEFNNWYNDLCEEIIGKFKKFNEEFRDSKKKFEECNKEFKEISENNEPLFSYGNAQKWVNMTIKNIYVVGALCEIMNIQHRFCEISKKFISKDIEKQLHIPIDNYILESIWNEENKKMWEDIEEEQKETQSDKSSLVKEIYCKNNKNKMKKYSADVVKPWSKWTKDDYTLFKKKFDENIKIPENQSPLEWENEHWINIALQKRK